MLVLVDIAPCGVQRLSQVDLANHLSLVDDRHAGELVYSRVRCRPRRATFSVSTERLSNSAERAYALTAATSSARSEFQGSTGDPPPAP